MLRYITGKLIWVNSCDCIYGVTDFKSISESEIREILKLVYDAVKCEFHFDQIWYLVYMQYGLCN